MSKASPLMSNFNTGELSPLLAGRADFEKYPNGASQLLNFVPTTQGPLVRRGGTRHAGATKNNTKVLLAPFEYSNEQAYICEFGHQYVRFWTWDAITKERGLLTVDGVPVEVATPYALDELYSPDGTPALRFAQSGDFMYLVHGNHQPRTLKRTSVVSFELEVFVPFGGPFDALVTDDATITYSATDGETTLASDRPIFYAWQVGTLLQIERDRADSIFPWEVAKSVGAGELRRSDGGVYVALTGGTTGTNRPVHKEGSMSDGGVQWEYSDSGIGYVEIVEYIDETHVKGIVKSALPAEFGLRVAGVSWLGSNRFIVTTTKPHGMSNGDVAQIGGVKDTAKLKGGLGIRNNVVNGSFTISNVSSTTFEISHVLGAIFDAYTYKYDGVITVSGASMEVKTSRYAFGAWSDHSGWPTCVTFFRERIWFARGQKIWSSVSADFSDFSAKQYGEVTDDMAITLDLSSGRINDIQWMVPDRDLVIGTAGGEFGVGELANGNPLSPSNRRLSVLSQFGSRAIPPIKNAEALFFVNRSGLKARETYYDFGTDGYKSTDLTVLAEHISRTGMTQAVFCADPDQVVWACRNDGKLIGLTWNNEQSVRGWHPHDLAGGAVQTLATIPAAEGDRDELWLCVKRVIDGQEKYFVEYMTRPFTEGDDINHQCYSDSALIYAGTATDRVTGLDHLKGCEVSVLSDGAPHPNVTVDEDGGITLQREASVVVVGLPYRSFYQSMSIEAGARDGTAQGKTKRIHKVVYRFYNTGSATVWSGENKELKEAIVFRASKDAMGQAVPLFTGDKVIAWSGGYEAAGHVALEVSQPVACTLVAVMPQVVTQDAR